MFPIHTTTKRTETRFFDEILSEVETDRALWNRAEAFLSGAEKAEPLLKETLLTPQDVRYHAEGPFVRDHLRLMLMSLYAVVEGKLRLSQVEELARLKEYGHEIEKLEGMLTEHVSWFEAFVLAHDCAKWNSIVFYSPEGSRGAALGFNLKLTYEPDVNIVARHDMRARYLDLYRDFASQHAQERAREVQALFYLTYEIDVKYPHHDRLVHAPVYAELCERIARAHQLTPIHATMLADIIGRHLSFKRFAQPAPSLVSSLLHLARDRGYDGDDFLDFAFGALFLDFVCGSLRLSAHGYWHEISLLVHAFKSEHEVDPSRRAEKLHAREEAEHRRRLRVFGEVGLDGMSLMELLGMEAGKEFGKALRRVQAAVIGQGVMPAFGRSVDEEIGRRALNYYTRTFEKGE